MVVPRSEDTICRRQNERCCAGEDSAEKHGDEELEFTVGRYGEDASGCAQTL